MVAATLAEVAEGLGLGFVVRAVEEAVEGLLLSFLSPSYSYPFALCFTVLPVVVAPWECVAAEADCDVDAAPAAEVDAAGVLLRGCACVCVESGMLVLASFAGTELLSALGLAVAVEADVGSLGMRTERRCTEDEAEGEDVAVAGAGAEDVGVAVVLAGVVGAIVESSSGLRRIRKLHLSVRRAAVPLSLSLSLSLSSSSLQKSTKVKLAKSAESN